MTAIQDELATELLMIMARDKCSLLRAHLRLLNEYTDNLTVAVDQILEDFERGGRQ